MSYLTKGDIVKLDGKWLIVECKNNKSLMVCLDISKTKIAIRSTSELDFLIDCEEAELLGRDTSNDRIVSFFDSGASKRKNDRMRMLAHDVLTRHETLFWLADRKERAIFFKEAADKYSISTATVRRFLRDYLQHNLSLHEIGSKYFRCGGRGKMKEYTGNKRAGRKGISNVVRSEEVLMQFEVMLKRYQKSKTRMSIAMLYEDLCSKYYSTKKVVNGQVYFEPYPAAFRPTRKQLYYFIKTHLSDAEKYISQNGVRNAWNNIRPLHSDTIADLEIKSIGGRYEMDEMETDYYLVCRNDRNQPIGRGIFYVLIDVYSKMITGFSVGLDNNSWDGAKMALLNMAEDKVEICKRAGIEIREDQWPVHGVLPKEIEVDNGAEYLGDHFEKYARENGIQLAFAPSRMGSFKPNVEQIFHQFNTTIEGRVPGQIIKGEYGSLHIKKAILTIEDFYKIVLRFILFCNNTAALQNHTDADVFAARIVPTPVNVWGMKMKQENGLRKIQNMDQYKYSLLSEGKAVITKEGIIFQKIIYTCEDVEWLEEEMRDVYFNGRKSICVRYDSRNLDVIYFILKDKIVKGWINERKTSNSKYFNCSYPEIQAINRQVKLLEKVGNEMRLEEKMNFNAQIDLIVKGAKKNHSGRNKKENIRDSRLDEKERLHKESQIVIGTTFETPKIESEEQKGIIKGKGKAPSVLEREKQEKIRTLSTIELLRFEKAIDYEVNVLGYDPE